MKKILGVLIILSLVVLNLSCKKDKVTEFDIDYTTTLTIPSTSITVNVPADFNSPEIPTDSKDKFTSEKTVQNLVDEIKMTKFDLSVANGNLNFLKSLNIYLKTSGLGDVLIASKTSIPQGVSSLAMDLQDVNIKEYIFKDKIQFRVSVTIQTGLAATQQLKMDQRVHVKAKLVK
ncbi:MAG: hypothetical protein Q8L81_19025 [Bacteroidota bacterium]|nr:hypothetical protein [Bacteroidota bacterium]